MVAQWVGCRRGGGWNESSLFNTHLNDSDSDTTHRTQLLGTENGKDAEEEEKLIKLKAQHKNKWIFGELSHYICCASHILHSPHPHTGACTGLNQPNESTQCNVQYHHDGKTNHNTTIDPFGIAVLVCFHKQFSTADVYHGSCCTCQ